MHFIFDIPFVLLKRCSVYVYLARPDSTIDEISVYRSRMRMGLKLAEKIRKLELVDEIDVVIPIPDSSTTAALQLAADLQNPYRKYSLSPFLE